MKRDFLNDPSRDSLFPSAAAQISSVVPKPANNSPSRQSLHTLNENKPLGFPHIIPSSETFDTTSDTTNIRLADGIATFLYNWNPDALCAFLDLNRGKFEYVQERPEKPILLIARTGQQIHVGHVAEGRESRLVYGLSTTGAWKPLFSGRMMDVTFEAEQVEAIGKEFAVDLLCAKEWHVAEGREHKVLWTKFSGEEGYSEIYDGRQQERYGLPPGWERMSDTDVSAMKAPIKDGGWPFELVKEIDYF